MQSYLALRYFRMIGRCGRHDYLTTATAAAATAATATAAAASFFILTSRALPPRPLELPPTLTALPQPVHAETRRSQSNVRRFARPALEPSYRASST